MTTVDVAVVAARFQPVLSTHLDAIAAAASRAPQVVVLVLGAGTAPSPRTPWSTAARLDALRAALHADGRAQAAVVSVHDVPYAAERWRTALAGAVATAAPGARRVGLIADAVASEPWPADWSRLVRDAGFAAAESALRDELVWAADCDWTRVEASLPPALVSAARAWSAGGRCAGLRTEAAFLRDFRARWAAAPYPPVFVTVDGVVTWRDEVLLVERARAPGRGLWALPGGFIDPHETLAAAVRREVAEETGLALGAGEVVATRVFDDPGRSLRGRTITHAFHFVLDARAARPTVRGADDARAAAWCALAGLASETLFEDHYAILQVLPGVP